MRFADDELMRYADGELAAGQARKVEAAMAVDAAVRARVEMFRATRRLATDSARTTRSPGEIRRDDETAARIRAALASAMEPPRRAPRRPAGRIRMPPGMTRAWRPVAAAAAVAAAIGFAWLPGGPGGAEGPRMTAVLDTVPSGESRAVDGQTVTVIATFLAGQGQLCREYEAAAETRSIRVAVACRDARAWRRQVSVRLADREAGYVPAAGDIEALDTALARLDAGAPLTVEEEQAALRALSPTPGA